MRERENAGTNAFRQDPAVRLMTYQLAYLLGISEGYATPNYSADVVRCRGRLAELGLKPFGT